jgi:hypothetical protein
MPDGKVKVHRVVCGVDCGVPVNPDVIRAQMEGAGRAVQRNFDRYQALRINEMPQVEVHIVASNHAPTGVGEPGVPPLAPAVANALARLGIPRVAVATGVRGVGCGLTRTWSAEPAASSARRTRGRDQAVGTVPPSMTYSVPVMEAARGDARNATRSATSPGLAGRPSGMPPSERMTMFRPPS